jgi:TRAP-type C4-dicarboxylate transport system substrate-binding protein
MPFGPSDPRMVLEAKRKFFEQFPQTEQDLNDKANATRVAELGHDAYSVMSKEPITTLADFEGVKIAAVGKFFPRWVASGGATPVSAGQQERYEMMRTGIIDADWLPPTIQASIKLYEQAKNWTEIGATAPCPWSITVNLNVWNKLTDAQKKAVLDAGTVAENVQVDENIPAWIERAMEEFDAAGVQKFVFPEEEKEKWMQIIPDIPAEWADALVAAGYPGYEMTDYWQQVTAELGWKWAKKWGVKK